MSKITIPWGIYGIHGTDKPWSISQAVSHGCVRMYSRDAEDLYNIVPIGTPVYIY
ncbi:MAG: L,D-transpeptidase [Bacillota bacterium]|nr:L,D-transpeptidase [Bacillota bacterium]